MRGHIRKRGHKWAIIVELDRDPTTGKRRQRWHSGYANKKAAERALPQILAKLQSAEDVAPSKLTVSDYLTNRWIPTLRVRQRRPSTIESYERVLRLHVTPTLGSIRLQALMPQHLNHLYADLLAHGRVNGNGGLSPRTVRYTHAIIRHALKDAMKWDLVTRNAADASDPPSQASTKPPPPTTWSATQVRQFLGTLRDDRLYAAWLLFATTGMRRGEVAGLRWDDIEGDRLSVRRALVQVGNEVAWSEPKTAYGRRTLTLDKGTTLALRQHRRCQARERLQAGAAYNDHDLVFAREGGTPIHPDRWTTLFQTHAKRAGLPRIRLHDLRHGWATLAIAAGIDARTVSGRLGHHSPAFTMATYVHAVSEAEERAATTVAALIQPDQQA